MGADGELFRVVVDGVERLTLVIPEGSPDPVMKARRFENGECDVSVWQPYAPYKRIGYLRWGSRP